jgi:hypothetical protein
MHSMRAQAAEPSCCRRPGPRRLASWQAQLEAREGDAAELEARAAEMLGSAREAAAAAVARREGAEAQLREAQAQLARLEAEVDGARIRLQVGRAACCVPAAVGVEATPHNSHP